jgi:hypothetical protein
MSAPHSKVVMGGIGLIEKVEGDIDGMAVVRFAPGISPSHHREDDASRGRVTTVIDES